MLMSETHLVQAVEHEEIGATAQASAPSFRLAVTRHRRRRRRQRRRSRGPDAGRV